MSIFHRDTVRAELTEDGSRIVVSLQDWRYDQIAGIPGSSWIKDLDIWTVPKAWTACLALRGVFGEALQLGPNLEQWGTHERNSRVVPCREHRLDIEAPGDPLLRPFQRADVIWLRAARRAILGNGTGSGKTVSACVALRELGPEALPAIVFCMKNMVIEWARHMQRWGDPDWKVQIVSGGVAARRKALATPADIYVMHYDVALSHSRLAPFGNIRLTEKDRAPKELDRLGHHTVIADEVHLLADPTAKRTRALWATAFHSDISWVWGLSATPMTNDLGSTWAMLHFISPDEWPAKTKFVDRYVDRGFNMWGGMVLGSVKPDTAGEFFAGFEPRFRRIPEEVALPQLPPAIYEVRKLPMTAQQERAYRQAEKSMYAELVGQNLVMTRATEQFIRLRQLASSMVNAENQTYEDKETGETKFRQLVGVEMPSNKIEAVFELLEEIEDPFVVFAEHRKLIDLLAVELAKKKVPFAQIVGGQTIEDRQAEIDSFQAGERKLIIATIAAGGTGVTLTRANTAVYLQRHTSMVLNIQADGRIRRIGSEHHEFSRYIEIQSMGTVDARVIELMHTKKQKLEDLLRDGDSIDFLLRGQDTPVAEQLKIYAENVEYYKEHAGFINPADLQEAA